MAAYLRLLGRPRVEHAGTSIALPPERRCQLLVLLALRRDWVARSELAALSGRRTVPVSRPPTCARRCIWRVRCLGRTLQRRSTKTPVIAREIGRMREEHAPAAAEVIVEAQASVRAVLFEIGGGVAPSQCRHRSLL
jgi:hypothetical protein